MAKHGDGLAKEIVKAVNIGEIIEPITKNNVNKLCENKKFNYSDDMKGIILSNSEVDATHSPTFKKYFKRIAVGKYVLLQQYRDLYFEEEIENSQNDTKESRRKRLSEVKNTKPELYISTTTKFKRNPDVVAEVLLRSKGKCEKCKKAAPFIRKSNNTPYLEVHHTISLSDCGEDTVDNCIAVCPNCHRELHYG